VKRRLLLLRLGATWRQSTGRNCTRN